MTVSIGEVLHKIGRPLVQAPHHSSLQSLSQLLSYAGLDAILLIDREKRAVGVATAKTIVHHLARSARAGASSAFVLSFAEEIECCSALDGLTEVAARMLQAGVSVLLVEENGELSATVTFDRLCEAALG